MRNAFILAILLCLSTVGCGRLAESPPESRAVVDQYFEVIRSGSATEAANLVSAEGFVKPSREEWLTIVDKAHAKLGPLKTYTVSIDNVTNFSGTSKSGIYTSFRCEAQYEKYSAVELFRVFQPASGGAAQIVAHNINSPGFVAE